ncbi:MAG: UDP-N-acetylmuramate--L-alanine ligase [Patescibacteria group bacterium]|jgi:UDP-N-acetylmuramate--alanine ligase
MNVDLTKVKKVYFIGIKGVAMSGLAVICKQRGIEVFGSDVSEKFITDKILIANEIEVFENFSAANLNCQPNLVIIGASWSDDNIEVAETKKRNLPWITDSEMRGLLSGEKKTIAVTGVHGKTTTTAMISYLFSQAGLLPSFLIGTGSVPDLKSNAGWGDGRHFIVEGDEYVRSKTEKMPKFLDLDPAISVITSVEWEHVDVFESLEAIEKAFQQLVEKTKDLVVACGDWPSVRKIISQTQKKVITYGFNEDNLWQACNVRHEYNQTLFDVKSQTLDLKDFRIKLFGEHNVLNALAAIIVGINEGLPVELIKNILKNFQGTERRFDVSENNGVTFIDDYAHHPSEIKATLSAARHRYPDQLIWCVFQPHMASRTKALLADFAASFADVNLVIFADIFASARETAQDITSQDLAEATKKYQPNVVYAGDLNQAIDYLKDKIKPGMVLVTMGAGDVYRVRDKLIN